MNLNNKQITLYQQLWKLFKDKAISQDYSNSVYTNYLPGMSYGKATGIFYVADPNRELWTGDGMCPVNMNSLLDVYASVAKEDVDFLLIYPQVGFTWQNYGISFLVRHEFEGVGPHFGLWDSSARYGAIKNLPLFKTAVFLDNPMSSLVIYGKVLKADNPAVKFFRTMVSCHELAHQWCCGTAILGDNPTEILASNGHWSFFLDSADGDKSNCSIMGGNAWNRIKTGVGDRIVSASVPTKFSDLDLYCIGAKKGDFKDAYDYYVETKDTKYSSEDGTYPGIKIVASSLKKHTFTMSDILQANGRKRQVHQGKEIEQTQFKVAAMIYGFEPPGPEFVKASIAALNDVIENWNRMTNQEIIVWRD
jgi:hypothetical protein